MSGFLVFKTSRARWMANGIGGLVGKWKPRTKSKSDIRVLGMNFSLKKTQTCPLVYIHFRPLWNWLLVVHRFLRSKLSSLAQSDRQYHLHSMKCHCLIQIDIDNFRQFPSFGSLSWLQLLCSAYAHLVQIPPLIYTKPTQSINFEEKMTFALVWKIKFHAQNHSQFSTFSFCKILLLQLKTLFLLNSFAFGVHLMNTRDNIEFIWLL